MRKINVFPLSEKFTIKTSEPYELPKPIIKIISSIWEKEKKNQLEKQTNGKIYSLKKMDQECLIIQQAEYRHGIARRVQPDLVNLGLDVRPLAVTGVIFCEGGIILGKRSSSVANYEGLWEPAPAGWLDTPDPKLVLMKELEEELGIADKYVEKMIPCGLVEDTTSGTFDVVFRLNISMSFPQIIKNYKKYGTSEYSELKHIKKEDIMGFLGTYKTCLLPALTMMLELTKA